MSNNRLVDLSCLKGKHLTATTGWTVFGSPETFAQLPKIHKTQILFLNKTSTDAVYAAFNHYDLLCGDDGWGNTPFSNGCFKSVEQHEINQAADLKKWLYLRGIAFASSALLLQPFAGVNDSAIVTTWKLVVKYATELFSRDNLIVVSPEMDWCLYYHHDGLIKFAKQPNWNTLL